MLPYLLPFILLVCSSRILQLTNKNLPKVLKSQPKILSLYHHPQCSYSQSYALKFTQMHNTANSDETVGMIDCSQQKILCKNHQVSGYPWLAWVTADSGVQSIDPYMYLGQIGEVGDEYLVAKMVALLKQEPYWIVVLFQEQGMPVPEQYKPKQHKHYDRVFYLSDGRVAQALAGFVNNKPGCWVYLLSKNNTGQLQRRSCGQSYQSKTQLLSLLSSISSSPSSTSSSSSSSTSSSADSTPTIFDRSNYTDQTILGYKQLRYWLQHYNLHMQISTHSKISMCSYLYVWSEKCQHCDYQSDLKVIKRGIQNRYKAIAKEPSKQQRNDKQVFYKKKIHTYDITHNDITLLNKLQQVVGVKVGGQEMGEFFILPNLVALCFATFDNRNIDTSIVLNLYKLDKIITINNVQKLVDTVIGSQHKYATNSSVATKKQAEEL